MFFTWRVEFNKKLRPVALNLGKDLYVLSKILKGSCTDVPDPRMFLLEDAIAGYVRFLLIVGTWVVGIALRLFMNIFFAIFPILIVYLLETGENGDRLLLIVTMLQIAADCLLIRSL